MPAKSITDAFVRNVKVPSGERRQITYIDTLERGLALVLVVSYGGTRTFRVLTYRNGKPNSWKLGTYPQMTVKDARKQARAYWQNPQKIEAQAAVGTFEEVARNWLTRYVEAKKLRSKPELKRMLENHVLPKWKNRPFLEIRRKEVNDLLDHVADNHGKAAADAVLATIRRVMTWYQSKDENYTSPIVKGMRRDEPKARNRILDDAEIRAVWNACDDMPEFGPPVKLALLTSQRRDKIATMRWADIKDGEWHIPSEPREKGNAGAIKLPQLALDILEAQPRVVGNPYVFASGAKLHFNSWSQRKAELDEKAPAVKPWRIHDLRRTARSLMARADVRPDVAERVLGHAIKGVEGVYDRHTYAEHKAEALKRLASLVEKIINPPSGNVVEMGKRRRK